MKGGKVIGQGSAGCVFDPPLLCEGETERKPGYVTKMLSKKDFQEEWREIEGIKPIIATIPNNENYFIVNQIYPCVNPQYDTIDDLSNFSSKTCNPLTESMFSSLPGETRDTIMDIQRLRAATKQGFIQGLNMPNGGPNLNEYTTPFDFTIEQFKTINNSLIDLLQNGVVPMNEAGLLHLDIKAPNMVFDGTHVRVIDWGLANKINPEIGYGLKSPMNPPIMGNRPFTNILFAYNKKGESKLGKWINIIITANEKTGKFNGKKKKEIASLITSYMRDSSLNGILSSVENIEKMLGDKILFHLPYIAKVAFGNNIDNTLDLIASQISYAVVEQCYNPDTGIMSQFDVKRYFLEVYQHNVDVFGLLSFYLTFLANSEKNIFKITRIGSVLDTVLTKYFYSETSAAKKYNIDEIVAALRNLNSNEVLYPTSTGDLPTEPPITQPPQNTPLTLPVFVREDMVGGNKKGKKSHKKGKKSQKKGHKKGKHSQKKGQKKGKKSHKKGKK